MQAAQAASTAPERSVSALAAAGFGALTLLALSLLHALSSEFEPSWRMVSEYANGRHGWLLAAMFVSWALSSWLLAYALYPLAATWPGKLGFSCWSLLESAKRWRPRSTSIIRSTHMPPSSA